MDLFNLPTELLLEIWDLLTTNKNSFAMYIVSKNTKQLGDKYGYIKSLSFNINDNLFNFITRWIKNHKTIQTVNLSNMDIPNVWLPTSKWPLVVSFTNCRFVEPIKPLLSDTKEFYYTSRNMEYFGTSPTLNIQWDRLPLLEILKIKVDRVSFFGLEKCTKLRHVIIMTEHKQPFPECIAEFTNLEELITNCYATKVIEFKSTKLNVCLMPTKFKLKSKSKTLPANHLLDNSNININSFM